MATPDPNSSARDLGHSKQNSGNQNHSWSPLLGENLHKAVDIQTNGDMSNIEIERENKADKTPNLTTVGIHDIAEDTCSSANGVQEDQVPVAILSKAGEEHYGQTDTEDLSEEEEDEPPLLKYTRLNQLPPNFFKKDPISTATFSEKVFIFGTHSGLIHLTKPDFTTIRSFKAHKASILSLYTDGNFFASGSMDGTVVIGSVTDSKDITMFDYKRPIHAVVLDKDYLRSRSFICGGMAGFVIYSSKSWLDQRVETYLDKDNGPIVAIHTFDDLVLWMNDKGITIYHTAARQVISVISKPSDSSRSDLYWPRVSFPEVDRALIAWGNYIWSLRLYARGYGNSNAGAGSSVKSRILPSTTSLSFRSVPEKKVEVEHVFKVDFLISGISSFNDDQWIVLAYNQPVKDTSGRLISQCPDLKILSSGDGSTVFEEELSFKGVDHLGLNDYHMFSHIGQFATKYYMLSARDGIVAEQVQLDDRLEWYLDKHMFLKAWTISQHLVTPARRLEFGVKHLDQLVRDNEWAIAAKWLSEILSVDTSAFPVGDTRSTLATKLSKSLQVEEMEALLKGIVEQWNLWGDIFIKSGHTRELTEIIPTDPRWNLSKSLFTDILTYWLKQEGVDERFYRLLQEWDIDLYDVRRLTGTIEHMLEKTPHNKTLRRTLCWIYESATEPSKAVVHLCELQSPDIIVFLNKHHILPSFVSDIPRFLRYRFSNQSDIETLPIPDIAATLNSDIDVLVDLRFEISPRTFVNMTIKERLSVAGFLYLEKLAIIDELLVRGFENARIELLAQFDRPKLLPFLMTSTTFDIKKALDICEANAYVEELVYLYGEVGENTRAMALITEQLDDPVQAIKFAKIRNDAETWEILLNHSYSRPKFITALLELADDQTSNFYNPVAILKNMKIDMPIEGLKGAITKISEDLDMNVIVNQLLLKIVCKRSEEISQKFRQDRLKGLEIPAEEFSKRALTGMHETIILLLDPKLGTKPQIRFGSDLVECDPYAKKLYTSMADKLIHVGFFRKHFDRLKAKEGSG